MQKNREADALSRWFSNKNLDKNRVERPKELNFWNNIRETAFLLDLVI